MEETSSSRTLFSCSFYCTYALCSDLLFLNNADFLGASWMTGGDFKTVAFLLSVALCSIVRTPASFSPAAPRGASSRTVPPSICRKPQVVDFFFNSVGADSSVQTVMEFGCIMQIGSRFFL